MRICACEPETRCKALAIGDADASLGEMRLPPGANDLLDLAHNRSGLVGSQVEDGSPREGVLEGRSATFRAHSEDEPPLNTEMEIGTSCRRCSRFCAVTTVSGAAAFCGACAFGCCAG